MNMTFCSVNSQNSLLINLKLQLFPLKLSTTMILNKVYFGMQAILRATFRPGLEGFRVIRELTGKQSVDRANSSLLHSRF